jgi:hypothetical protein
VAGGRRRLHNEELHNLYISPNTDRVIKSRRMGEVSADIILVGKPEGKISIGRITCRWEDDTRMNLNEIY